MIKKLAFILMALLQLISCTSNKHKDNYEINASINNLPDNLKVLLMYKGKTLDSTYSKDSNFQLIGSIKEPKKINLGFFDTIQKTYSKSYISFWLDNSNIKIKGDYKKFKKAELFGAILNEIITDQIIEAKGDLRHKLTSYYKKEVILKISDTKQRNIVKKTYKNKSRQFLDNFIYENANSKLALDFILSSKRKISRDSIRLFYKLLNTKFSQSESGQALKNHLSYTPPKDGDAFIEIEATDINGKALKLSQSKGKVVLLQFGASWCAPCKTFNKEVVSKLVQKFPKEEFEVVYYSMDKYKKDWKRMVTADTVPKIHMSNVKGVNDDVALKYDIQSIPDCYLISKQGKLKKPQNKSFDILAKEIAILLKTTNHLKG